MINGLTITPNFISDDYEKELIKNILSEPWNNDLKRRTQHYGYKYDYSNRTISTDNYLGPFPKWLDILINYLVENAKLEVRPDQVIINEYFPGQGIAPHIDKTDIFENHICSISLGSDINMIFQRGTEKEELYLKKCSLLEMINDARYKWSHSITPRKSDEINGTKVMRNTRYSLTFRKVIIT